MFSRARVMQHEGLKHCTCLACVCYINSDPHDPQQPEAAMHTEHTTPLEHFAAFLANSGVPRNMHAKQGLDPVLFRMLVLVCNAWDGCMREFTRTDCASGAQSGHRLQALHERCDVMQDTQELLAQLGNTDIPCDVRLPLSFLGCDVFIFFIYHCCENQVRLSFAMHYC
jgi:hypothetical protein